MKITKEIIYDIKNNNRYTVSYNAVNEVLNINRRNHLNKLYYLDDYANDSERDFIWISDDNKIIQIDDNVLELIYNTENFIEKMRTLKTEESITNYISFLRL